MKTRKLTAILLALCMLLSLSISAFAADDAVASGTIPDSKITWELDGKGWLTISGSGDCSTFTSKDDQPWAEYRRQITQVWFDGMESLAIPDLAYWFEDCTNLTTAEIPSTTPVIGRHAFYNCPLLTKLSIYYGEHTLDNIGEDAFWREADSGDTLYVAYIIGYPDSSVPFHDYDWNSSNRSDRYFYDVYGAYKNADSTAPVVSDSAIKKAPAATATYASTGIVGTCPSCNQYSLQGTYVEQTHTSRGHQEYYECYKCHYVKNLGTYVYKDHGDGSYGSWTCPSCGSHTWVLDYESDATCTRNGYREYSCDCGQSKRETIYATGHSYSYGSWEQYSTSQHRREAYCRNCGDSDYEYASHSMSYGAWSNYSDSQHSRTASCRTCGYSTTDYGTEVFSVTVPVTLPLIVDESGEVHAGTAEIINGSTGEVVVSSVSISTKNGWQLVPYTTDMAHEKVDAQLLGFKINGAQTTKNGNAETFALSAPWEIAENSRMTLSYDAVVSAVSKAITEQEVLSVVFVLEWRGE